MGIPAAVIPASSTTSAAVAIGGVTLTGLITPAALTGTTLTFQVSQDNATFVPLYLDTNTQYSLTVAVSRAYALDLPALTGWQYLKVVSGATEAAARTIILAGQDL